MGEALFIERYDGRIDDEFHAEFTSLAPNKAGQKRAHNDRQRARIVPAGIGPPAP